MTFSDTEGHWAEQYIAWATERGWFKGYPDGTFRPDDPLTRAQAATLIWRQFAEPEPTGRGIPIGFWGMNGYWDTTGMAAVGDDFGATISQISSSDPAYGVETLLPAAKAAGMKLSLRMTGGHSHYTTDGDFDLAKWKDRLTRWADSGVQPFIDDGTLALHMVLDDISNWSGRDPTGNELDEMARHSKELLPGLVTYVRKDASKIPVPTSGRFTYLDAAGCQYTHYRGDIRQWAPTQIEAADDLNLGIIFGLGIVHGGSGESGQPTYSGWWAMSPNEIRGWGTQLLSYHVAGAFLSWEFDAYETWPDGTTSAVYFSQPAHRLALTDLSVLANHHPTIDLLKR